MKICGFNKTTLLDYPGGWPAPYSWAAAISDALSVRTELLSWSRTHSTDIPRMKFWLF